MCVIRPKRSPLFEFVLFVQCREALGATCLSLLLGGSFKMRTAVTHPDLRTSLTKPLPFTKAAIKRAIAAAQEQGAVMVEMRVDGTIRVLLSKDYEVAAVEQPAQTAGDGWDTRA